MGQIFTKHENKMAELMTDLRTEMGELRANMAELRTHIANARNVRQSQNDDKCECGYPHGNSTACTDEEEEEF
jgi:hypothetical protein